VVGACQCDINGEEIARSVIAIMLGLTGKGRLLKKLQKSGSELGRGVKGGAVRPLSGFPPEGNMAGWVLCRMAVMARCAKPVRTS